jgi:hypothetical protein
MLVFALIIANAVTIVEASPSSITKQEVLLYEPMVEKAIKRMGPHYGEASMYLLPYFFNWSSHWNTPSTFQVLVAIGAEDGGKNLFNFEPLYYPEVPKRRITQRPRAAIRHYLLLLDYLWAQTAQGYTYPDNDWYPEETNYIVQVAAHCSSNRYNIRWRCDDGEKYLERYKHWEGILK